jgi:hypothetical protein
MVLDTVTHTHRCTHRMHQVRVQMSTYHAYLGRRLQMGPQQILLISNQKNSHLLVAHNLPKDL